MPRKMLFSGLFLALLFFPSQAHASTPSLLSEDFLALPQLLKVKHIYPPKRIVVSRHFVPNPHPTPEQVANIITIEQGIWGGPSVANRVACESGNLWNASNGQYHGLLQIGSWWGSVYPYSTPLAVNYTTVTTRKVPIIAVSIMSSNYSFSRKSGYREQEVITHYHGRLPADAGPDNGYAAIRVGQRAASGAGPTTGWTCSL